VKPVLKAIAWADLPPQPWRNQRGITRTVASHFEGGAMLWRVSVAEIEQDGPFSTFPGFSRTAVLMRGAGLTLESEGAHHRFGGVGEAWQFDGEDQVHARLGETPARLWNIMVARDRLEARTDITRGSGGSIEAGSMCALLVLDGSVSLADEGQTVARVAKDEILILEAGHAELALLVDEGSAHWALVTYRPSIGF
jgi:environmental stress-induced protein Ves